MGAHELGQQTKLPTPEAIKFNGQPCLELDNL